MEDRPAPDDSIAAAAIVIVGAGQAGGQVAHTLRRLGHTGRLILLGAEVHPPHERPPLSKSVLLGEADRSVTHLLSPADLAAMAVDFRPGTMATAMDRAARSVTLADGSALAYDRLVLATGCRARPVPVPGGDLPGVRLLRTVEDSLALGPALTEGARIAIIGGGWIGLEVAAAARKRGASVTVIELADRLCARAAPPVLSDYLYDLHVRHGVDLRLDAAVTAIQPGSATPLSVSLDDGTHLPADAVVVGIGAVAEDGLASAAGLDCADGILTDTAGRTTDPAVFACGDVARYPHPAWEGAVVRLESWANARDQATTCAHALMGQPEPLLDPPWFWSDQHGVNIQIVGRTTDAPPVRRDGGDPDRFSLFWVTEDRLTAAIAVNQPMDIKIAKRLIAADTPVDAAVLADPGANLRSLLRRAG